MKKVLLTGLAVMLASSVAFGADKKIQVGVSIANFDDTFLTYMMDGMKAYAKAHAADVEITFTDDAGQVVLFFQPRVKFGARYSTLGFNDSAALDDGAMWPVSFAIDHLEQADEVRVAELIRRAVGTA